MMWASLLLVGIISSWWGALAFAAAPPAELANFLTPNNNMASPKLSIEHHQIDVESVLKSGTKSLSYSRQVPIWENFGYRVTPVSHPYRDYERDHLVSNKKPFRNNDESSRNTFDLTNFHLYTKRNLRMDQQPGNDLDLVMEQYQFSKSPHHSIQSPFHVETGNNFPSPSSLEMLRISRSVKQRKNRTKVDSPREQRRRCRMKNNCRGRNWCPDMDVGNRAFLAPTVFEGKARSMSSLRKPGSNYAVTFEVRQVYKSQAGFLPLQKNDSVRLHFRDKAAPGKSTVCGYEGNDAGQQQQQRDNQSGMVRANIKRGKVYLVFVNRVGPRNFTILGEPVIRSKKNEQAVQAVVRPDYELSSGSSRPGGSYSPPPQHINSNRPETNELSSGGSRPEERQISPRRRINSNRPRTIYMRTGQKLLLPNQRLYTSISNNLAMVFYNPANRIAQVYQKDLQGRVVITDMPYRDPVPPAA